MLDRVACGGVCTFELGLFLLGSLGKYVRYRGMIIGSILLSNYIGLAAVLVSPRMFFQGTIEKACRVMLRFTRRTLGGTGRLEWQN